MKEYPYRIEAGLTVGLRPSHRNKRGKQALVQSTGMYPDEGALVSLEELTRLDTSGITPTPVFPYPQVFELHAVTIVLTATQVYEVGANGALTLKLSGD